MKQLVKPTTVANVDTSVFVTMLRTEILTKGGHNETIVTLLTDYMWEEVVTGINDAMTRGGKAAMWQTFVYALNRSVQRLFTTLQPITNQ